MPCSQQSTSAYQHFHQFIGPYSKTFQSCPHLHTLLISSTVSILSSITTHICDKRYLFVRFLHQNFVCISRLPCVLRTPATILLDLVTIIKITWSCPLRNFLNPQHLHFSNDFPKLSQYATVVFRCSQIYRVLQNTTWSILRACTTAYAVSNSVIQTALCQ
jgi:hypothetical protein